MAGNRPTIQQNPRCCKSSGSVQLLPQLEGTPLAIGPRTSLAVFVRLTRDAEYWMKVTEAFALEQSSSRCTISPSSADTDNPGF